MGTVSIWHWLVVLVVVMGDFGKGLKSFKKGMKEEDNINEDSQNDSPKAINTEPAETADTTSASEKDKAANL